MCLSAQKKTVDPCVAPLLGGCARTVSRAPGRQPTIVRHLQILHRHTRCLCFLGKASRVREELAKLHRVRRGFPFSIFVRFEPDVRLRVPPVHGAEFLNLLSPLGGLLSCQARVILVGPQRIILFKFACLLRLLRPCHLTKGLENPAILCKMLNTRTLLFGLMFGALDAVSLPTIKAVSKGMLGFGWMVVPFVLYAASPFLFLEGLKGETLTILNLIWDLSSDLIITLIGLFYFRESLSYTKGLGVMFSFIALFLMSYESEPLELLLGGGMRRITSALNIRST
jgi:hypothetical protein